MFDLRYYKPLDVAQRHLYTCLPHDRGSITPMLTMISEAPELTTSPAHASSIPGTRSVVDYFIDHCDVGLGVFANRDLAPGEVILEVAGPIIDFAETKRRGPRECMAIQIGYDRYIDTQAPGVFVNHSCNPNAGITQDLYLVALRPIVKDEEIRFDYSTTMEEHSFTMHCLCGALDCRHVVRDFSTLPQDVQHEYIRQGVVMSFIVGTLQRQV